MLSGVSTRIGNSKIDVATGSPPTYYQARFEWWDDGRAQVTNDNAVVLRSWEGTVLEHFQPRMWRLFTSDGEWLATITVAGCCGAKVETG